MAFKYFAYGSNMLSERMTINCPTAVKQCVAVLKDYKLAFCGYANTWKGATATIVKEPGSEVWGIVWAIEKKHEDDLTKQEFTYEPIMVNVFTSSNQEHLCKIFVKEVLPTDKNAHPSVVYKTVIINGATEHNLPQEYIKKLKLIEDNGYVGAVEIAIKNPLENVKEQ